jgi:micrococcal nuclease
VARSSTLLTLLLLPPLVVAGLACKPSPQAATDPPGTGEVTSVIDGDTIEVRIGDRVERVRLLGIDTPETVDPNRPVECHGPEASALAHQLLPEGTAVRLERDQEARDHFGRLLAYVFLASEGTFVNEAILVAGEAEILAIEPNHAYAERLAAAAEAARAAGAGLWGGCPAGTG